MGKEKIEQLEKKIEQIKKERFNLAMKDTWCDGDFTLDNALWQEQLELQRELEKECKLIFLA